MKRIIRYIIYLAVSVGCYWIVILGTAILETYTRVTIGNNYYYSVIALTIASMVLTGLVVSIIKRRGAIIGLISSFLIIIIETLLTSLFVLENLSISLNVLLIIPVLFSVSIGIIFCNIKCH